VVAVVLVAICIGAAVAIFQNQQRNSRSLGPAGAADVSVASTREDGVVASDQGRVGHDTTAGDAVLVGDGAGTDEGLTR
jgi:hypothetical protein